MHKFRVSEYRVGVIGPCWSGKTVLLTSLIDHLKNHDPGQFRIGRGKTPASVRGFVEIPPDKGWSKFNFQKHRTAIVEDLAWPKKTTDRTQFACEFRRSDWRISTAGLKLHDLPGERVADAIMCGCDYAQWSDHLTTVLTADRQNRGLMREFLTLAESIAPVAEADLLRAYRTGLARLVLAYKPYVSPSTFYVDLNGGMVNARDEKQNPLPAEKMTEGRACGLPGGEFVPIPESLRAADPGLAQEFGRRYDVYKAQVVAPWVRAIRSCHALVILVDVLTMLENGVGMFNDNHQMLRDVLEVLNPGKTLLGGALRKVFRLPAKVSKIAFVAPKLDLVHPDDHGSLEDLARQFAVGLAGNFVGLKYKFFACSAVRSTTAFTGADSVKYLQGLKGKEKQRFPAQPLPDQWPREWQPGEFRFPRVQPYIPARVTCPPEQCNLDTVFNFVMG